MLTLYDSGAAGKVNFDKKKYSIAVTFLIFNVIILLLDGFQPRHPPFILTVHMVLFITCRLTTLWVKFNYGHLNSSSTTSLGVAFLN